MLNAPYSPLAFAYGGQASDSLVSPVPLAPFASPAPLSYVGHCLNPALIMGLREQGSSGSIASGYGLDHRAVEVRSSAETKGFFSLASVSRPTLGPTQPPVQWVPGVLSQGLKRGRGVTLTTHPI
jgi:hypothetical protein